MKSERLLIIGTVVAIVFTVINLSAINTTTYNSSTSQLNQNKIAENIDKTEIVIESGDTFATIMESFGVSYEESQSIFEASKEVYDFTKIHAGKIMHIVFAGEVLAAVDYDLSDEIKIVIEKNGSGFNAREEPIMYDIKQSVAEVSITSSLFADGALAGLTDTTLLELADIFGWDIDFSTDIREGDSFVVVYEKRFFDNKEVGPGKILATKFQNQGVTYWAYYYQDQDGKDGYYDTSGRSLSRKFLKSPINFGYVSSGFSYSRVNPVTKQMAPHRAIDYAAPQGTPVITTADGTIRTAGSKGDLGITVEIQHNNYLSQYAHLSKIARKITKGVDVIQGDIIGYVGSTGVSTGPHLQYALFENEVPINPLKAELPKGEPLNRFDMENFSKNIIQFQKVLN